MPYKKAEDQAAAMRRYRARKKSAPVEYPEPPADPVEALATWARDKLIVPPGHPASGAPMELPGFAVEFLRDGWSAHESALCCARKNAKSAICAVLVLGHLAGPLRRPGWRGAVCSIGKEKAAELRGQIVAIAEASGIDIEVRRSPYPGSIKGAGGTQFDTLSADRGAGHASGFDLVLIDETGLLPERARDLLAGLRSSVSAKGGRLIHLSIRGDSPLYGEILNNPATVKAVHAAPDDCDIDDRDAWAAANPGLGTIKQESYMLAEVERIRGAPGDEPNFRAFDLNQELSPTEEMIITLDRLREMFVDDPPPREGRACLAWDFGEATSLTAAAAIWPESGRLELWLAAGDIPDLKTRGRRDDANYIEMESRGELTTYPGRIVPVGEFLADVAADLAGVEIAGAAADGWKDNECRDFLDRAGVGWPVEFRRTGQGKTGAADLRGFQRLAETGQLKLKPSLALTTAIRHSKVKRGATGNAYLNRAGKNSRIDVLSALIVAAGLSEPYFDREPEVPKVAGGMW